jgi:hypothetical protein
MSKVNEAAGAIQPKTGDNVKPLVRSAGYGATVSALQSKTRSGHPASSMANHWEGVSGYGDNENIVGYGSGNSS